MSQVIKALAEDRKPPWNEAAKNSSGKLAKRQLVKFLEGKVGNNANSLLIMLGCVSPASTAVEDTRRTLDVLKSSNMVTQSPATNRRELQDGVDASEAFEHPEGTDLAQEVEEEKHAAQVSQEEIVKNKRSIEDEKRHIETMMTSSMLRRPNANGGRIVTVLRARPLLLSEEEAGARHCLFGKGHVDLRAAEQRQAESFTGSFELRDVSADAEPHEFACDFVHVDDHNAKACQQRLYSEVGGTILEGVQRSQNVTLLCLGSRGAGKTYSMKRPDWKTPVDLNDLDAGLVCQIGRDLVAYSKVRMSEEEGWDHVVVKMSAVLFCAPPPWARTPARRAAPLLTECMVARPWQITRTCTIFWCRRSRGARSSARSSRLARAARIVAWSLGR